MSPPLARAHACCARLKTCIPVAACGERRDATAVQAMAQWLSRTQTWTPLQLSRRQLEGLVQSAPRNRQRHAGLGLQHFDRREKQHHQPGGCVVLEVVRWERANSKVWELWSSVSWRAYARLHNDPRGVQKKAGGRWGRRPCPSCRLRLPSFCMKRLTAANNTNTRQNLVSPSLPSALFTTTSF